MGNGRYSLRCSSEQLRAIGKAPAHLLYRSYKSQPPQGKPGITRGKPHQLLQYLEDLVAQQQPVPPRQLAHVLIDGRESHSLRQRALKLLKSIGGPPASLEVADFTALISALAKLNKCKEANEVFDLMTETFDVQPNVITFNALIDAATRTKDLERAFAVFYMMEGMGIRPDIITFTSLINGCLNAGDLKRADTLLEVMRENDVQPNTVTLNSLITSYGKRGQADIVFRLLTEYLDKGVEPDRVTLKIALHTFADAKDMERALWVLQHLWERGRVLAEPHYFTLILNLLAKMIEEGGRVIGIMQQTLKCIQIMDDMHIRPNLIHFNRLIDIAGRLGDTNFAFTLFARMKEFGVDPDHVTFNSLVYACTRTGDLERAAQAIKMLEGNKLKADVVTFNSLLQACAYEGSVQNARRVLVLMAKRGLQPDEGTFIGLMAVCAKSGEIEAAQEFWEELITRGNIQATKVTFAALLNVCAEKGDLARSWKVLRMMKETGVVPDDFIFVTFVKVCTKARDTDGMFVALQKLEEMGMPLVPKVWESLGKHVLYARDERRARQVLERMEEWENTTEAQGGLTDNLLLIKESLRLLLRP